MENRTASDSHGDSLNVKIKSRETENTNAVTANSPTDEEIMKKFEDSLPKEHHLTAPSEASEVLPKDGYSVGEQSKKNKDFNSENREKQSQVNKAQKNHRGNNKRKNNGENGGKGSSVNDVHNKTDGAVATIREDEEAVVSGDLKVPVSHTWKVPDGGWGWVVVVSALVISLIVDGLTYTFGIFLGEFERVFQQPKSTISLASSLQVGLYLFIGPVVSALTNRFGCRPVIIAGSLVASFAFIVSSWSTDVTILIVTYGIIGGIGFGLMYLPAIVAVSIYFDERRAIATGIAVCGSGIGTFILAPLTDYLLSEYNWSWTLAILGALILNGVVFGALVRPLELQMVESTDDNANKGTEDVYDDAVVKEKSRQVSISSNNQPAPEEVPLLQPTNATLTVTTETKAEPNKPQKLFFSSTPQLSTDETLKSTARPRSNTLGTSNLSRLNPTRPTKATSASDKLADNTLPRVRAPIGLAFISLSDANLNKIREDIHLPLSRKDIHHSGTHAFPESEKMLLKEDKIQGLQVKKMKSITSLTAKDGLEDNRVKPHGIWSCLPASARDTLEEMLSLGILKDKRYWFVLMGNFFCMIGFYVPFVYVPDRAKQIGIGEEKAAFLLSIIGITNTVGRVLTGVFINIFNIDCLLVTSLSLALAGIVTVICPVFETYAGLAIMSAIFGICVAAYISLCSVLLCELLGVENLTNAFGFVILFRGVACIMGPPIAGAIIDATGIFDPSFYIGGGFIMLGALSHALLLIPCIRRQKSTSLLTD